MFNRRSEVISTAVVQYDARPRQYLVTLHQHRVTVYRVLGFNFRTERFCVSRYLGHAGSWLALPFLRPVPSHGLRRYMLDAQLFAARACSERAGLPLAPFDVADLAETLHLVPGTVLSSINKHLKHGRKQRNTAGAERPR